MKLKSLFIGIEYFWNSFLKVDWKTENWTMFSFPVHKTWQLPKHISSQFFMRIYSVFRRRKTESALQIWFQRSANLDASQRKSTCFLLKYHIRLPALCVTRLGRSQLWCENHLAVLNFNTSMTSRTISAGLGNENRQFVNGSSFVSNSLKWTAKKKE